MIDGLSIDISKTRFIVTCWPHHRIHWSTYRWIEFLCDGVETRLDNKTSFTVADVTCARNSAIKRGAIQSNAHYEHFVFLDQDVRPIRPPKFECTTGFLQLETDVKCCQVEQSNPMAWSFPYSFHESIWCTSREVLETIGAPWFMQQYTADGTAQDGCLCKSFQKKVLDAGFSISHGGWAEHDRDRSWC